jgi:uncharacterized protein YecE (DUF72 family)
MRRQPCAFDDADEITPRGPSTMPEQGRVWIGTSGWSYDHWVGPFYPPGTASRDFLPVYARRFGASEINTTFYRLPASDTLAHWVAQTPPGFMFACKASRYITHTKKLKDPATSTPRFFDAIAALGDRCGPVLFQLPPNWHANVARLDAFLAGLPDGYRYAFEFRDDSWQAETVYDRLKAANAALVIADIGGTTSPCRATADLVYLRLHGPEKDAYTGTYTDAALRDWAARIGEWRTDGRDVVCFFDNDASGHAPNDAIRLQTILSG